MSMPDSFTFWQFEHIAQEISAMSAVIGMARDVPSGKYLARPEPTINNQIIAAGVTPQALGSVWSGEDA
jgi:hypothetical protein